jgi:hypothetical protein
MQDEQRGDGDIEEAIEDLEAPAAAMGDVSGGAQKCAKPTCVGNPGGQSNVVVQCQTPTCRATSFECSQGSDLVVFKAL